MKINFNKSKLQVTGACVEDDQHVQVADKIVKILVFGEGVRMLEEGDNVVRK